MEDDIYKWIKHHRMIRIPNDSQLYVNKKNEILQLYNVALQNRKISAQPYVCDSHQADIRQIPQLGAIICDVHYFDIARLVASSFYVNPTYDMPRLSNALIADSMICHGKILSALHFARQFIRSPYATAFCIDRAKAQQINMSVRLQTVFALVHEIEHFEHDGLFNDIASIIGMQMETVVDRHNQIANYINSIDLQPISQYLDYIDVKAALKPVTPDKKEYPSPKALQQVINIIGNYGHSVLTPGISPNDRMQLLIYACDNYLRGVKSSIIDKKQMVTESTCDLLALLQLFDCRFDGISRSDFRKKVIEAYMLSLLTSNLIWSAMNLFKINRDVRGNCIDMIYLRREQEKHIIPLVLCMYSRVFGESLSKNEMDELCDYFERVSRVCDNMYAEFSEYTFKQDYPDDVFIPHGSSAWNEAYAEVDKLLHFPI